MKVPKISFILPILAIQSAQDLSHVAAIIELSEGYRRPDIFGFGVAKTHPENGGVEKAHFTWVNHLQGYEIAAVIWAVVAEGKEEWPTEAILTPDQSKLLSEVFDRVVATSHYGILGPGDIRIESILQAITYGTSSNGNHMVSPIFAVTPDVQQPAASITDAFLRVIAVSKRCIPNHMVNLSLVRGFLPEGISLADFPMGIQNDVLVPNCHHVMIGTHLAPGITIGDDALIGFDCHIHERATVLGILGDHIDVGVNSYLSNHSLVELLDESNKPRLRIGSNTFIASNTEVYIDIGDHCVVSSGVRLFPNTEVFVLSDLDVSGPDRNTIRSISAGTTAIGSDFEGKEGLYFSLDSEGVVMVNYAENTALSSLASCMK